MRPCGALKCVGSVKRPEAALHHRPRVPLCRGPLSADEDVPSPSGAAAYTTMLHLCACGCGAQGRDTALAERLEIYLQRKERFRKSLDRKLVTPLPFPLRHRAWQDSMGGRLD
ncbi:hypothetical protein CHELA20_53371 [Hyphomicrobiales bacterium]|nr:hypothetical protein CHELA41_21556 [Hyphomicrobiales bacterium]CAH1684116.1 hypothetical protein CHELA20_53371 [Hyphomicrobiales bacterium]